MDTKSILPPGHNTAAPAHESPTDTAQGGIQAQEPPLPVDAPILEAAAGERKKDAFTEAMEADPTITRFGRFHIRQRCFWWAVSSEGFGSRFTSDVPGSLDIYRKSHIELTTTYEGMRAVRRLIIGRFMLQYSVESHGHLVQVGAD